MAWLSPDLESCCERHCSWNKATCLTQSGGDKTTIFTTKWYVNHQDEICQMDSPKVEEGGKCGGPTDSWKTLYVTSKHCCEAELGWIAVAKCDAQSNLASFDGSSQWYVDWEKNKVRHFE